MESRLLRQITLAVRRAYPDAYVRKIADRMSRGLPDLLILIGGLLLFVEVKTPEGRCSPIQMHEHLLIETAGGRVIVARSPDEVLAVLENLLGE
jgi:VRR-NUC domain